MKPIYFKTAIFILLFVVFSSSCSVNQSNANSVKNDELVYSSSAEINFSDMNISTTISNCKEKIAEKAFNDKDENVSFDKKIVENFFLGVWRNDDEREFIIGENTECDVCDFFDNYGLIKTLI